MTDGAWTVRLSDAAQSDFDDILRWTARRFGKAQAASYGELIAAALARLEQGPNAVSVRRRPEVGVALYSLHVGRRGRHLILFRCQGGLQQTVDVLRILHDAMDVARYIADT